MDYEKRINEFLESYGVIVRFSKKALMDLSEYKKQQQEEIIALILKRAKNGPLIKPDGLGEPLKKELAGFTKIKPKHLKLRIIYRPKKEDIIYMDIIAIGPRNQEKVYKLAAERILDFQLEMANR